MPLIYFPALLNQLIIDNMKNLKCIFRITAIGVVLGLIISGCGNEGNNEPLKSIISTPPRNQEIKEGEMIYFEGNGSGGVLPYSYIWNFGVGFKQSSEKVPGARVFNYEGAYKVTLTVIDLKGKTDISSIGIFVNPKDEFQK